MADRIDPGQRLVDRPGSRTSPTTRSPGTGPGRPAVHGGREGVQAADVMARRRQPRRDMRSDEPGRAGHENAHTCSKARGGRHPARRAMPSQLRKAGRAIFRPGPSCRASTVRRHGNRCRPALPQRGRRTALGAVPDAARLPAHRGGQRLHRRLRRDRGELTGPASCTSRSAVSAPPVTPGCSRRAATSSASWTPTPHSIRVTCPPWRTRCCPAGADLMLGRRSVQGKGAWPWHARIGNRVLAAELRRRIGVPVTRSRPDARRPAGGAARADHVGSAVRLPAGNGDPRRAGGWRIAETDVPYYPRTGKSKVTGTLGGTVRTVRDMRRVLASVAAPAS